MCFMAPEMDEEDKGENWNTAVGNQKTLIANCIPTNNEKKC